VVSDEKLTHTAAAAAAAAAVSTHDDDVCVQLRRPITNKSHQYSLLDTIQVKDAAFDVFGGSVVVNVVIKKYPLCHSIFFDHHTAARFHCNVS